MKYRTIKSVGLAAAAVFGIAFVGGCASQGSSSVADSSQGAGQVCTYSSPIGSHIGSRHCMSRSKYKAQQEVEHKKVQKNSDPAGDTGGDRG